MHIRRVLVSLVSFVFLPLLLMQFQNCAPNSSSSANGGLSTGVVGIPEGQTSHDLQFVTSQIEIQDSATAVSVDGFCNQNHNGAAISWAIWSSASSAAPLLNGSAQCSGGSFQLNVGQLEQMVCGVTQTLVVQGEWGSSNTISVTRLCQPLASQVVSVPAGSPAGTECEIQYSPATVADQPCQQVCFRAGQLMESIALNVSQCSSLAATLAGP